MWNCFLWQTCILTMIYAYSIHGRHCLDSRWERNNTLVTKQSILRLLGLCIHTYIFWQYVYSQVLEMWKNRITDGILHVLDMRIYRRIGHILQILDMLRRTGHISHVPEMQINRRICHISRFWMWIYRRIGHISPVLDM